MIEELITEKVDVRDKESYYNAIIQTIIRVGRAGEFIVALCELIQRLIVDHLHILGDISDRGPGPHMIMDKLMTYHCLLYTSIKKAVLCNIAAVIILSVPCVLGFNLWSGFAPLGEGSTVLDLDCLLYTSCVPHH